MRQYYESTPSVGGSDSREVIMRRFLQGALLLLALFLVALSSDVPSVSNASPDREGPTNQRIASDDACVVSPLKSAVPTFILLGETTEITLHADFVCRGAGLPLHVVLVLDASSSMGDT
jgi:hypothetical protein